MKTWFTVCVLCLMFIACDDNVEFNQPAFQANIEDVVWQGNTYEASRVSNVLTVLATLNGEKIKLEVPFEVGVDTLGAGRTSNATFTNVNGTEFSTLFSAVNEPTVYYSDGLVSVSEINSVEGYVSGEFWFIGYDNNGLEKVNVTQGVFFKVPLVTE
ncbi:DUF6252 family protein [Formosa sp. 4Alg 33]|uniref:DUF6252 family protein n=1 Tax=Formosa sp. 4Alg 33 TaxID=3382189 RepID=UPI003D9C2FC3